MYGNIYDLAPDVVGLFDVVMAGQILVHLPDGISALAAAASVCRERLIVVEGSFIDESPIAALCGRVDRPEVPDGWYHGW